MTYIHLLLPVHTFSSSFITYIVLLLPVHTFLSCFQDIHSYHAYITFFSRFHYILLSLPLHSSPTSITYILLRLPLIHSVFKTYVLLMHTSSLTCIAYILLLIQNIRSSHAHVFSYLHCIHSSPHSKHTLFSCTRLLLLPLHAFFSSFITFFSCIQYMHSFPAFMTYILLPFSLHTLFCSHYSHSPVFITYIVLFSLLTFSCFHYIHCSVLITRILLFSLHTIFFYLDGIHSPPVSITYILLLIPLHTFSCIHYIHSSPVSITYILLLMSLHTFFCFHDIHSSATSITYTFFSGFSCFHYRHSCSAPSVVWSLRFVPQSRGLQRVSCTTTVCLAVYYTKVLHSFPPPPPPPPSSPVSLARMALTSRLSLAQYLRAPN